MSPRSDPLEARLNIARRLPDTPTVAIIVDQMDCDCVRYTTRTVVPSTVMHVVRELNRIYEGAEGPIYDIIFATPDVPFTPQSRDLALEAFENGHPHVVVVAH